VGVLVVVRFVVAHTDAACVCVWKREVGKHIVVSLMLTVARADAASVFRGEFIVVLDPVFGRVVVNATVLVVVVVVAVESGRVVLGMLVA
jgi:hypothetical protein